MLTTVLCIVVALVLIVIEARARLIAESEELVESIAAHEKKVASDIIHATSLTIWRNATKGLLSLQLKRVNLKGATSVISIKHVLCTAGSKSSESPLLSRCCNS